MERREWSESREGKWSFLMPVDGLKVLLYFTVSKSYGTGARRRRGEESWLRNAFLNFVTGNSRWTRGLSSS